LPDIGIIKRGERMPFIYFSQGVASLYPDFTERLMSHLALRGTEITQQAIKETAARMHVKHTDEQGYLDIAIVNENIKVSYMVERVHKEISKGVMGAIAGAGLGGVIGTIKRGKRACLLCISARGLHRCIPISPNASCHILHSGEPK